MSCKDTVHVTALEGVRFATLRASSPNASVACGQPQSFGLFYESCIKGINSVYSVIKRDG